MRHKQIIGIEKKNFVIKNLFEITKQSNHRKNRLFYIKLEKNT